MSTRGIYGLVVDDKVKVGYNHFDSYPENLGLIALSSCNRIASDFDNYYAKAEQVRRVDPDDVPTSRQVKKFENYLAEHWMRNDKEKPSWYDLLHALQGDFLGTINLGFINDNRAFAGDSLFCEWGWLINFDDRCLECYRGFVPYGEGIPLSEGRFADMEPEIAAHRTNQYGPIHLLGTFPFDSLPDEEDFIVTVQDWFNTSCKRFNEEPQYETRTASA